VFFLYYSNKLNYDSYEDHYQLNDHYQANNGGKENGSVLLLEMPGQIFGPIPPLIQGEGTYSTYKTYLHNV
jgi:hypothetical protein